MRMVRLRDLGRDSVASPFWLDASYPRATPDADVQRLLDSAYFKRQPRSSTPTTIASQELIALTEIGAALQGAGSAPRPISTCFAATDSRTSKWTLRAT